jgi:hypothetical protein
LRYTDADTNPNGNIYTHSYCYTNCNPHSDSTITHTNSHSYCYTNCNSHSDSASTDTDRNAHAYANGDGYSYANTGYGL